MDRFVWVIEQKLPREEWRVWSSYSPDEKGLAESQITALLEEDGGEGALYRLVLYAPETRLACWDDDG
jgi:hypothetical protein